MFKLVKINNAKLNVPEMELLPVTASETFVEGEALHIASGLLTKASGTTKPTYIAAKSYVAPATGAQLLPCYRVLPQMVFEAEVTHSATAIAINLGTKLTVSTAGLGVTDVVTSGIATVVDTLDHTTTNGKPIHVIFE